MDLLVLDLLVSEIRIYSSDSNRIFIFENRYKITNISTNYNISTISGCLADGHHPTLSFHMLHATFLEFSDLVH